MTKNFLYLFVFILTCWKTGSAQNPLVTDSLILKCKSLPENELKVDVLNQIAHRLNTEETEKALNYCHQALTLSNKIKYSKGKADALNGTGLYFYMSGEYDKAITFLIKSYNLYDSLSDDNGKSAATNYLGNLYLTKGDLSSNKNDYKQAEVYFNQSHNFSLITKDTGGVASALNSLGIICKRFGDLEGAEKYIVQSMELREKVKDVFGLSAGYTSLANLYEDKKELEKAIEYNRRSLEVLGIEATDYDEAVTFLNVGSLLVQKKSYKEGIDIIRKGYDKAESFNSPELLSEACIRLSEAYKQSGDFRSALFQYEMYSKLKDSLLNTENNSQITRLQMLYETEKKNKAIALLNKTNELKESQLESGRLWRKVYIFGIVFLALVSFIIAMLIYNRYKIKNRANEKLQAFNDEILSQKTEIEFQKRALEEKNKEITDSIMYARRIQQSLLPSDAFMKKALKGDKN